MRGTKHRASPLPRVTIVEEWANSITHGIGLALSIAGQVLLVLLAATRGETAHVVTCSIFGGTLVFMYAASTLYHSFRHVSLKRILRIVDHVAIYLLIAGTYTPFLVVRLGGGWGWTLLCVVWGLALGGTVFKLFFTGHYPRLSTLLYVAMGWLIVVAIRPLLAAVPVGGLLWLAAGGLCYTGGLVFFVWDRLPFNHAIWHLFVLAGSICHYCAVVFYVLPA